MPAYLVDVNLPYYFSLWHNSNFLFVKDINDEWKDGEIWNYALTNGLTIITKDTDFFDRVLVSKTHPKVIHICFGNLVMKEFFLLMEKIWPQIEALNGQYELVKVYKNQIVLIK